MPVEQVQRGPAGATRKRRGHLGIESLLYAMEDFYISHYSDNGYMVQLIFIPPPTLSLLLFSSVFFFFLPSIINHNLFVICCVPELAKEMEM